jgi:uncharacterized protein (UPF0335 family)
MASPTPVPGTSSVAEPETEMTQPIIVDLGRQRASRLADLKEGEGELWDEVLDVIAEVKDMLGAEADGKVLLPVIMIYEKTSRRRRRIENILFPLADLHDDDDDDEAEDED